MAINIQQISINIVVDNQPKWLFNFTDSRRAQPLELFVSLATITINDKNDLQSLFALLILFHSFVLLVSGCTVG
ncbi:MAG: hypothetical protein ABIN36_07995 [Ferruginibacter sp.]